MNRSADVTTTNPFEQLLARRPFDRTSLPRCVGGATPAKEPFDQDRAGRPTWVEEHQVVSAGRHVLSSQ